MISCGTVHVFCCPCSLSTFPNCPAAQALYAKPHIIHYNDVVTTDNFLMVKLNFETKSWQFYIEICVIVSDVCYLCAIYEAFSVLLFVRYLSKELFLEFCVELKHVNQIFHALGIVSQRWARQIRRALLDITLHWLVSFHLCLLTICFWCCCCYCCWRVVVMVM